MKNITEDLDKRRTSVLAVSSLKGQGPIWHTVCSSRAFVCSVKAYSVLVKHLYGSE